MHLSDEVSDIYSQSIDIALRFGVPKDSQLIAAPLFLNNARILVASPDYIAKNGLLTHPLNCNAAHHHYLYALWRGV
ncbi:hypothetical protein P4S68_02010 [Pseudoalteromonas sp. Hal099]